MPLAPLYKREQILKRVGELGSEISRHYANLDEPLIVIGILKGSFIFLADLVRALKIPCEIDFIEASSYGSGTISSGEVKIVRDVSLPIENRDVLIVEDIVDTGITMSHLFDHLRSHQPRSVSLCSFLQKPSRKVKEVKIDFLGFTIEDHFVVGYGLDFNNRYRELPDLVIYSE